MVLKQVLEVVDLVDSAYASGEKVAAFLEETYGATDVTVETIVTDEGSTDFISIRIAGSDGKSAGGTAPTLGVLGRLGGLGARPEVIGMVSDADGAVAALAAAAKLLDMQQKGDVLPGDVLVKTHVCPNAPTMPHKPVPFMGSPVDMALVNAKEVDGELDAILSIDTTKGNRIINHTGIALSPTIKSGAILKTSDDLLDIMESTTGELPWVFAVAQQDITPYGNGLSHLNSILQPATATDAPVVGVAITTAVPVAGCATGASHFASIESAARFSVEVAKAFGAGACAFYDEDEFALMTRLYGSLKRYRGFGSKG